MKRNLSIAGWMLLALLLIVVALFAPQMAYAQAPSPDSYEENDTLTDAELAQLRTLGEMYCRPVVKRPDLVGASTEG